MELVEASAKDLDPLVDRWYSLASAMEAYDELNELAHRNVDEVPDDGFRAHLDDDHITDYLIVHTDETSALSHCVRAATLPDSTHIISAS